MHNKRKNVQTSVKKHAYTYAYVKQLIIITKTNKCLMCRAQSAIFNNRADYYYYY